jgi:hypothetical protein
VLLTLVLLEVFFRLMPVSGATLMDYHFDPELLTYPAGHRWTVSTGWDLRNVQQLQANNLGFAAARDFVPDPDAVAMVGDSFVEASALESKDRPAEQLMSRLPGRRPVYALGSPGTGLLDYAQRVRMASQRLGVRDVVVWVTPPDAREALCGSGNVHSRCLNRQTFEPRVERLPPAGMLKRVVRHSALAQYVLGQLKIDPMQVWQDLRRSHVSGGSLPPAAPSAASIAQSQAMVEAVLDEFHAQVKGLPLRRLVFLVDGKRGPKDARPPLIEIERARMLHSLRARGADVLDLEPVFADHHRRSTLSPEIGPYDHHLNALGVQVVTTALAAHLASPVTP